MLNSPTVSVVIPCYNHGLFLREAIASVEQCESKLYEIIIVNDGSTDSYTQEVLRDLEAQGYHVINQHNQGLGQSRNNGIKSARGKYILSLDADNCIKPDYIYKSIEIFEKHESVGVVYSDVNYFGEESGPRIVGEFSLQRLLTGNYIDACAVYRKKVWEECGGFATNMPLPGLEDWDFWLRVSQRGWQFYYIKECLFNYRFRSDSMIRNTYRNEKYADLISYVYKEHVDLLAQEYKKLYLEHKELLLLKKFPLRALLRISLQTYAAPIYKIIKTSTFTKLRRVFALHR